jgi:hypothetical protein
MYSAGSTRFPSPFVSYWKPYAASSFTRLKCVQPPSGPLFVCLPCHSDLSSGT